MDNIWSIDKIENNIVLLENITTKEKKEVETSLLPQNIKEGSIISCINNTYKQELSLEEKRRQEILEKFNKLKNK